TRVSRHPRLYGHARPLRVLLPLSVGKRTKQTNHQPRWDSFMRMLDPVASRLPWMVAAGNHEIETNGAYPDAKPFLAYESRFRMPAVGAPTDL
ncbi:unnamed protein product, partial [Ectocarpus sp. 8 AP-2014]